MKTKTGAIRRAVYLVFLVAIRYSMVTFMFMVLTW